MKHLLISITLLLSAPIFAASFDCSKAGTPFEKTICSNPKLSSMDDQLAKAYFAAKAATINPDQFKADQISWIKSARACGTDAGCIESSYKARLAILAPNQVFRDSPQPNTNIQAQVNNDQKAIDAASCGMVLGAIGMIQGKEGKMAASKENLSRFSVIDDQWSGNPAYKLAKKNLDANIAKDPSNVNKNLAALTQGCRNMGVTIARSQ